MKKKALIIDDESSVRSSLRITLLDEYECLDASSIQDAIIALGKNEIDFVLLDIRIGEESGIDFLRYLNSSGSSLPVICFSGEASYKEAIDAYKLGALDFLQKPISPQNLFASIRRCISQHQLKERSRAILSVNENQPGLIGNSNLIQQLRQEIFDVAKSDAKVLILGETGTGKEIVASMIHFNSTRRNEPFIVVDCGSLPASLLESTLFGFKKGAFTGANQDQVGKLECADGGTLFLDELAELSLEGQNRLLRFLENGEIQRVGSNKTTKVNVRVIAATSRNINEYIAQGKFRSDLYYRLGVFTLKTPPLRDLGEDVLVILEGLLTTFCSKMNRPFPSLDEHLRKKIMKYRWPGNVRELRNLAERFAITGNISAFDSLDIHDIDDKENRKNTESSSSTSNIVIPVDRANILTLKQYRALAEREYICSLLNLMNWNVTQTAIKLGIDRVSLHQKITALDIQRK